MKKIALVFGSTGQDGTLMCSLLLKKKYKVYALSQKSLFKNLNFKDKKLIKKKINYYDYKQVKNIIKKSECKEIYFFGGRSSPSFSFKNYQETFKSHFLPVYMILQSIIEIDHNIKFFNTSSAEIFKKSLKPLSENSPKEPNNPYGLAKLNTLLLVKYFRDNYKLRCFSGILFNHESKFRPNNYVIPKVFDYIRKKNFSTKLKMGNLNVIKDFGWAPEYIEIIFKIMQNKIYDDFIIATGKSHKLRKIISVIFKAYNLNWKKYVSISNQFIRSNETMYMYANIDKLRKKIKAYPKIFLAEIILNLKKINKNNKI